MEADAVVLDIEASGLTDDSYPIEIGWIGVFSDENDSFLIKPADTWNYWDEFSETVHGISQETLLRAGVPISEAVTRLSRYLAQRAVYSDAVQWDSFWLDRLYQQCAAKRTWNLKQIELPQQSFELGIDRPHRALVDAEALARTIRREQIG